MVHGKIPSYTYRTDKEKRKEINASREFEKKKQTLNNMRENIGKVICEICGKSAFTSFAHYATHFRSHEIEKNEPVICPISECSREFMSKAYLQNHYRKVHWEIHSFKCNTCKMGFDKQENLAKHNLGHSQQKTKVQCSYCNGRYKPSKIEAHIKLFHADGKIVENKCDQCGKKFKHKHILTTHMRNVHSFETVKCHICESVIKRCYYQTHLLVHNYEKSTKFTCRYCGKFIKTVKELDLSRHEKWCSQKQFRCELCDVFYKLADTISRHSRSNRHTNALKEKGLVDVQLLRQERFNLPKRIDWKSWGKKEQFVKSDVAEKMIYEESYMNT